MKLEYTQEAYSDLQQIQYYIASVLKNPKAASRIITMITRNCRQLERQPLSGGALEPKVGLATDLRYLICENYLAFYRVGTDTVMIVRVLDGRTDYVRTIFYENS